MALQEDRADTGADGSVRKAHYGSGKQPWDTIVELGFGAEFAAGNVIKYIRRTKDPEHSVQSARWYYARLREMFLGNAVEVPLTRPVVVFNKLLTELTTEEVELLVRPT